MGLHLDRWLCCALFLVDVCLLVWVKRYDRKGIKRKI